MSVYEVTQSMLNSTSAQLRAEREYHHRIGVVTGLADRHDPDMLISRVRQIARTWRSCLAYRLSVALGWYAERNRRR